MGEFSRYFLGSGLALAIDYSLLLALTELAGLHYLISSAIGFFCGAVFLYFLSINVIFKSRQVGKSSREFTIFFAIGVAGLCINQALMFGLVDYLATPYQLAKLFTIGVVFMFNFTSRKVLLFQSADIKPGISE